MKKKSWCGQDRTGFFSHPVLSLLNYRIKKEDPLPPHADVYFMHSNDFWRILSNVSSLSGLTRSKVYFILHIVRSRCGLSPTHRQACSTQSNDFSYVHISHLSFAVFLPTNSPLTFQEAPTQSVAAAVPVEQTKKTEKKCKRATFAIPLISSQWPQFCKLRWQLLLLHILSARQVMLADSFQAPLCFSEVATSNFIHSSQFCHTRIMLIRMI